MALLTPRYWWFLASSLTRPLFVFLKRVKFSTRSSSRAGSQVPRIIVSSDTIALLALAVDPLPLGEVLPLGGDAADPALAAVGEDDEGVVPEKLRDGRLVVAEVAAGRRSSMRLWAAFSSTNTSGRPLTKPTRSARRVYISPDDPELRGQEEVVVGRLVPVDDLDRLVVFLASPSRGVRLRA